MRPISVCIIAGARPNFIKVAPLYRAMSQSPKFSLLLVHTGQHYNKELSDIFFQELSIPKPDISLDVGSGSHAVQTARIMERFEAVLFEKKPDVVIVVGDVNSTIACALVTAKAVYPSGVRPKIVHIEAGLRSFDRTMPEEINRILTDSISDYFFITEESAEENLKREAIPPGRIFFVGNLMIDTLKRQSAQAMSLRAWENYGLLKKNYAVLTLHRPSNVDDPAVLRRLIETMQKICETIPVLFPVHPRTKKNIDALDMEQPLPRQIGMMMVDPLGYLEFLSMMSGARLVITDSGGIQEETTVLNIPCVTLRENTERPVTIQEGSNVLAGTDPGKILKCVEEILQNEKRPVQIPKFWDGEAADRIVRILENFLEPIL